MRFRFFCAVPLVLALAGCPDAERTAQPDSVAVTAAAKAPAADADPAAGAVTAVFGDLATLATARPRRSWAGDFNGDGIADLLTLVTIRAKATELPEHVKLIRPWPANEGVTVTDDLSQGAKVALVVFHGVRGERPADAVLLQDPNPISILDTEAAAELTVAKHTDLASFEESGLAAQARGDVIVVPTEAGIDIFLYYDGSTYRSLEPLEMP